MKSVLSTLFGVVGISLISHAQIQTEIPIPDTLSGTAITLDMHQGTVPFFDGALSNTFGLNQYNYLGPTLVLHKGQHVSITVNNNVGDTTNLHWHGLQVPAMHDGPMTMIMDGESWNPDFDVINRAATFWYHPHAHKNTALHALKGAAGLIIVRDEEEAALALPRNYGVDDFPIIVQSIQYDSLNQVMPRGMQDSTIFVNGVRANYGYEATLNAPAQVVRMRLLNASGERTFNFGFSNNHPFSIIGSDGGLLTAPVNTTRVRISPGERYEILIDLSALNGQDIYLMSYASELPMGVQGGPTMPMPPGSTPMDSPINGINFNVLHVIVGNPTANAITAIPTALASFTPYTESQSMIQRNITMSAASMMVMDGPFFFNNLSYDMERIDYYIPIDNIEIWQLQNQTMVAHPFHIHDIQFNILSRDGNLPPAHERGWKDVVFIESMETVQFIAKFDVYSDTVVPYVHHCHILMHEDDGMMGQFVVVPPGYVGQEELTATTLTQVFPNPTTQTIQFTEASAWANGYDVKVFDGIGKCVLSHTNVNTNTLDVSNLPSGTYVAVVRANGKFYHSKFVKQ